MREFQDAVKRVIGDDAETVLVVSSLWSFAHRLNCPPRESGKWVLEALDGAIGPHRTLILPAFTYSFGRTRVFDLTLSTPETGAVAEVALTLGTMHRSSRPMTSYLVRGPKVEEFLSIKSMSSFGTKGPLGWICRNNTSVIGLGMADPSYMGWIICHHAEQVAAVPYRYHKRIAGKMFTDGQDELPCHEDIYVRSISGKPVQTWRVLNEELVRRGLVRQHANTDLAAQSAYAHDINNVCVEILTNDPYRCFDDPAPVKEWVENGKQKEIDSLKPCERLVGA